MRQVLEHAADQPRVVLLRGLAEVGRLAGVPQPRQIGAVAGAADDQLVAGERAQRRLVLALVGEPEAGFRRRRGERAHQAGERGEVEPGVAPFGGGQRRKDVALDCGDDVGVHLRRVAGDAERAVALVAAGAAGDLADLLVVEPAGAAAVELAQRGEGDVVDVHVEAHADRVGGDQKVDLARLEEGDLGVAGAGRQRAHDHRRAAAMAADQFGDGVDRVGREGDDGGARRQAGQLLRAGIGELREAVARLDDELRRQAADQRRRGRRAEQHGLADAARVQQAVGEDVAALRVGAQLDLVDGEELDLAVERHRLDRGDPVARRQRHDLLFAGHQRHRARAARLDDAVVDLARQQPQRQADHPGRMAEHALDRQMRLASVGGAENGDEARSGRADRRVGHRAKVGEDGAIGKRGFGEAGRAGGPAQTRRRHCEERPPGREPGGTKQSRAGTLAPYAPGSRRYRSR